MIPPEERGNCLQAHEGYPLHIWSDAKMCAAYTEGTQVIRANTSDIIPSSVEQLNGGHYRLNTSYDLYNIQPGDLLAVRACVLHFNPLSLTRPSVCISR